MNDVDRLPVSLVVVDGLDECGTPDSRIQLTAYLLELAQLAPWLKVIVTSRPNEELARFFENDGKMVPRRDLFQEEARSVSCDISRFFRHRLAQLLDDDEELDGRNWLTDDTVGRLASRANGLFIWAQTAYNAIRNSVDPDNTIEIMLSGESSEDAKEQLGSLYMTVLKEALGGVVDDMHKIKYCVAAVIIARTPLADTTMAELLANRVSLRTLRLVIPRLASVLYRDQQGAVRVLHRSFSNYMVEQCPEQYRIERDNENLAYAISCMQIMVKELKFNICELEDSMDFNHDIPDLAARIQTKIPAPLQYSCLHWVSHLGATPVLNAALPVHQLITSLLGKILLSRPALYWIEVLSLLGRLYTSESCLLELMDWVQVSSGSGYVTSC